MLPDVSADRTPAQAATLGGTNAPLPRIRHALADASRVWVPEMLPVQPSQPIPALRGLPFSLVRAWGMGDNIWLVLYARNPDAGGSGRPRLRGVTDARRSTEARTAASSANRVVATANTPCAATIRAGGCRTGGGSGPAGGGAAPAPPGTA